MFLQTTVLKVAKGNFQSKSLKKDLWRSLILVKLHYLVPGSFYLRKKPAKNNFHNFHRGVFRTLSRWSFFVNIMNGLKSLTIFTKKLHLRCFTRFCVRLCSEVTSSIYQTYKFKVYCNSFWRHCNVFDVVFSCIKETLCLLSNVMLSKNLELLCDCILLQIQKQSFILRK